MEDRIAVDGKVYFLRTEKEKNTIVTHFVLEENESEKQLFTLKHKKSKKENLMKFHKKALALFFKALQKKEPISEESLKKLKNDGESEQPLEKNELTDEKNSAFEELCSKSLRKEVFACFVLKNDDLFNYIREESSAESENLIIQVSAMVDFIRDNKKIEHLIGKWHTVVEVYDVFQMYCREIADESILVIVSSRDLPVGSMMKINEETKEIVEKAFLNHVG